LNKFLVIWESVRPGVNRDNKMKASAPFDSFLRVAAMIAITGVVALTGTAQTAGPQSVGYIRDRGRAMLKTIKEDIKKLYYDENFHGMNLDERFKLADEKIKTATSNGQIFGIIAQVVVELNDSHTSFSPPGRYDRFDYGWKMRMIGDLCYVVEVDAGSDAEIKGLRVGDVVYSIDGYEPTRANLWKIKYSYYRLNPRPGMQVVVQDPDGQFREINLMVKATAAKDRDYDEESADAKFLSTPRYFEMGNDLLICKLPEFDLDRKEVDKLMKRAMAHTSLILDLRGNPGGYVVTLQWMLSHFFGHDVKIGDLKGRKEMKPMIAKARADQVFNGKLVVLVDSGSSSASELFSRVIQLEKRGTVIGDRTAGAVMRSRYYPHSYDRGTPDWLVITPYGLNLTDADVIMSDGKSLEHTGVTPDELILPSSTDLASRRDPVLARAASLLGINIDPQQAGAIFPAERDKTTAAKGKEK